MASWRFGRSAAVTNTARHGPARLTMQLERRDEGLERSLIAALFRELEDRERAARSLDPALAVDLHAEPRRSRRRRVRPRHEARLHAGGDGPPVAAHDVE